MKKLLVFFLVMGCILFSVSVLADQDRGHDRGSNRDRGSNQGHPDQEGAHHRGGGEGYSSHNHHSAIYPQYDPRVEFAAPIIRPFPVIYSGPTVLPDGSYPYPTGPFPSAADPGDSFPWQYYPDSYAQQYYDLDNGEVIIRNGAFLPSTVRVHVGETVVWQNKEGIPHRIISAPGEGEDFDSGNMIYGSSYSVRINEPGAYDYYDALNPWMHGRVVVSS